MRADEGFRAFRCRVTILIQRQFWHFCVLDDNCLRLVIMFFLSSTLFIGFVSLHILFPTSIEQMTARTIYSAAKMHLLHGDGLGW